MRYKYKTQYIFPDYVFEGETMGRLLAIAGLRLEAELNKIPLLVNAAELFDLIRVPEVAQSYLDAGFGLTPFDPHDYVESEKGQFLMENMNGLVQAAQAEHIDAAQFQGAVLNLHQYMRRHHLGTDTDEDGVLVNSEWMTPFRQSAA